MVVSDTGSCIAQQLSRQPQYPACPVRREFSVLPRADSHGKFCGSGLEFLLRSLVCLDVWVDSSISRTTAILCDASRQRFWVGRWSGVVANPVGSGRIKPRALDPTVLVVVAWHFVAELRVDGVGRYSRGLTAGVTAELRKRQKL